MLVKIVDYKDKVWFINAAFVKSITAKGPDESLIQVSGWANKIRVKRPVDDVAVAINASMPDAASALALMEDEQQQQQQAAMIAMIG